MSDEPEVIANGSVDAPSAAPETAVSTPPANQPIVDDEEQKQNTRLGRKVARMENDMQSFMNEMRAFMAQGSSSHYNETASASDDLPEIVSSPDDVRKIMNHVQREESMKYNQYQTDYRSELARLGVEEPMHMEIVDEMLKNHNVRHTGMGRYDAALNYERSRNSLMMKKLSSQRPNVQGSRGASPSFGVTGASATSQPAPIELDDKAAKFARSMGMTEESIRKALKGG